MNVAEGLAPIIRPALEGRCPQCGGQTLFGEHIAHFAPRCSGCDLDFAQFNVGDGPAAFLILIVGALITGLALSFEVAVHPPFWLHMLIWIPLTTVAVVGSLRVAKAALLILEYRNQAREGRLQPVLPPQGSDVQA
ncbi:DUF983 domain-containing protein [Rhizorhapis suberifaciens]|uniref:DUF983 domain-containing protein n=1 Tax=Rhizorhapis suberifaciens TaxID=13656 RepID=UPI00161F78D4|nr:DUF983 domain-containing protein [Rhizorhapis suberifaciens]